MELMLNSKGLRSIESEYTSLIDCIIYGYEYGYSYEYGYGYEYEYDYCYRLIHYILLVLLMLDSS